MVNWIFDTSYSNTGNCNESAEVKISCFRIKFVLVAFCLIFIAIIIRLCDLSQKDGNKLNRSIYKKVHTKTVLHSRPTIVDRNGNIIAINLKTASLYANPRKVIDTEKAMALLEKAIVINNKDKIANRLNSNRSFVWIRRNLTPKEKYEINKLGIPGFYFKNEERRIYPQNNLFSHILGSVNLDGHGIAGIERYFEQDFEVHSNDDFYSDKRPTLSVDIRVQKVVRDELQNVMQEFKAIGASAIVMDANSFEVLSMVSLPDYDLNDIGKATSNEKFNRSTYGVYEMGSTFKIFNMALGYEFGQLKDNDLFDLSKPLKVDRFTIRDYSLKKNIMDAREVFIYSSNIGTAGIALKSGCEKQRYLLKKLGLLDKLELEITEKGTPLYPRNWGKTSCITMSYGHGIAVTPMHVVTATASIINGGILKKPTFIKADNEDKDNYTRVVSEKTSDKIRKIMRMAVEHGTGKKANVSGYLVGGKTGSADKPKKGKYNTKVNISSFVGAFPMNKPQYVVLVMVDEPIGNERTRGYTTGGYVAAPVVGKIIEKIAPILNISPVDENNYFLRKEFWYEPYEPKK